MKTLELTHRERLYLTEALRIIEGYPSMRRKMERQIGTFGSEHLWSAKEKLEDSL